MSRSKPQEGKEIKVDQSILRKGGIKIAKPLVRIGIALGISLATGGIGFKLTSASSFGERFYSPEVQLIATLAIAFISPFALYSGLKQAKPYGVGWSYLIGAKIGATAGLFIGLAITGFTIYYQAMWIMGEKKLIAGAFILGGLTGLLIGTVVGLIMLPLARIVEGVLSS